MLRPLSFAFAASFALVSASASAAMTTGQFLTRADALRSQGITAMLSPDFAVLRDEAKAAKTQLKAENAARIAQHQRPIACVPEGESIGIEDMLDALGQLPPASMKLPLKNGYAQVFAKRYPCR